MADAIPRSPPQSPAVPPWLEVLAPRSPRADAVPSRRVRLPWPDQSACWLDRAWLGTPTAVTLDTMNRALIVIDVQESFRQRSTWAAMSNPDIVAQVGRLVDAARASGDLVVWVLHSDPGTGTPFDPATGHVRLIDGLDPRDGEPLMVKTSVNAFTTTNLQQTLTSAGVREIVICGIRTEQCCETTARVGSDLGFEVTFVTDATTTSAIPAPDALADQSAAELLSDPRALCAEDIIERTERILLGRGFATIASTDEIVASSGVLAR